MVSFFLACCPDLASDGVRDILPPEGACAIGRQKTECSRSRPSAQADFPKLSFRHIVLKVLGKLSGICGCRILLLTLVGMSTPVHFVVNEGIVAVNSGKKARGSGRGKRPRKSKTHACKFCFLSRAGFFRRLTAVLISCLQFFVSA